MRTVTIRIESELKDMHAREPCICKKNPDIIINFPQVFRNNRRIREHFSHFLKKRHTGSFEPFTVPGCLFLRADTPIGAKTAEMVNPDFVEKHKINSQTLN